MLTYLVQYLYAPPNLSSAFEEEAILLLLTVRAENPLPGSTHFTWTSIIECPPQHLNRYFIGCDSTVYQNATIAAFTATVNLRES